MINLQLLLLILAFVCFLSSAVGVPSSRVNLQSLGLCFWVLTLLVR